MAKSPDGFQDLGRQIVKTEEAVAADVKEGVETLISWFDPMHKRLKKRYSWYERWHQHPHHKKVHWSVAGISLVLVLGLILSTVTGLINPPLAKATSTWTQTTQAEFNGGTQTNVQTTNVSGGEVKLSNGDFSFKRSITIDNSAGGALTNYHIKLDLSIANFDFTKTQSDGDDIGFLDADNTTSLDFWTQSWDSTNRLGRVWVEVPSIDASSTKTIYMYYGDSDAVSASSYANTMYQGYSTSGLQAMYYFDEGSGSSLTDSSGNSNNSTAGTLSWGTPINDSGFQGSFNGSSNYATVPRSISDDFSIAFWIKTTQTGGTGQWYQGKSLVDGEVCGGANDFGTALLGSKFGFGVGNGDTTISSTTDINNGAWHYVVATRTKSTGAMKVYVDTGAAETTGTGNTNSLTAPGSLGISYNNCFGGGYFSGNLDEIAFYNRALEQSEIETNYNAGYYNITPPIITIGGATINSTAYASQPDWYNASWGYRTALTVDNTGNASALTNYQVAFNLDSKTLIDASKMQADGDDIRFADSDGTTLIDYYLEGGINTVSTKLWVEVPSIGASSSKTIYIYYGNIDATAVSSGTNTFSFFDDFDNLTNWTTVAGSPSVASSIATIGTQTEIRRTTTGPSRPLSLISKAKYGGNITNGCWASGLEFGRSTAKDYGVKFLNGNYNFVAGTYDGTANEPIIHNYADNAYHDFRIGITSGQSAKFWVDSNYMAGLTSNVDASIDDIWFVNHSSCSSGQTLSVDWVAAGNYTSPEPIVSPGSNETTNSKTIYSTSGNLVSSAYNTAQFSNLGTISWDASVPASTEVKFQIRTADTEAGLTSATYYGPTGTSDYYTTSGTSINSTHNSNQWVQYKAYFSTTDATTTATLNSISVTYDITSKVISAITSWAEGTYSMTDLTVNGGATLTIAGGSTINVNGTLTVTASSTITIQGKNASAQVGGQWVGEGSTINATTVTIDSGSSISANGQGYTAVASSTGNGPGGTTGGCGGTPGAGYGGSGGDGAGYCSPNTGGSTYGSVLTPTDLGSAAGSYNAVSGAAGGGAIELSVSGTLTLAGNITANGGNGGERNGGSSGGSIYVIAGILAGSGTFSANGGTGDVAWGGGGGGGRLAIYYTTSTTFSGSRTVTGGTGLNSGSAGTNKYGGKPTATLTSPADAAAGISPTPDLTMSVDDAGDRTDIVAQLQYKQYDTDPDCAAETWASGVTTSTSRTAGGATTSGWSGGGVTNGLYDVSAGAKSPVYSPTLTGKKYYCWRVKSASLNSGDYNLGNDVAATTGWGDWATARQFFTNTPPGAQTITASQGSDGTVSIGYEYQDNDLDTLTIAVFYRNSASGWALNEGGTLSAGDTTITVTDASRFPTSGTILIDNEEISYTGKSSNDLTGATRGANSSTATTHSDSAAVYLKASTLSGATSKSATVAYQSGSLVWTAATDYDGYYDSAGIVRVTVNDTYGSGYAGANAAAMALDTKDPASTSVSIAAAASYTNTASNTLTLAATDDNSITMRFSNNNSTWSDWEAYGVSKSWDLTNATYGGNSSEGVKTAYVQFKDAKNNTSSVNDAITYDPNNPTGVSALNVQNISIAGSSLYRNAVHWAPGSDTYFRRYQVLRSTNGVDYAQIGSDITDVSETYYVDTGLTSTTTYYYEIKTEDWASNSVTSSATTVMKPAGAGISMVSAGTPGASSATITWTTATGSNSMVEYKTSSCSGTFSKAGNLDESATSHSVALSALAENTTYYYKVRSRDAAIYEVSDDNSGVCYTLLTSSDVPTGSVDINNAVTYTNSATVTLKVSGADTSGYVSQMKFSNNGTTWSDYEAYGASKSWDITNATYGGTTANGSKTVYVKLKDNSNIESTASISDSISYDNVAPVTTAPTNIETNDTTPTISWSAATEATSGMDGYYIKIGTTDGGTETLAETFIGNVTSYTPISALADGTYYVQIKGKDLAGSTGNYSSSGTIIVETVAPISNSISIPDTSGYTSSATVNLTLASTGASQMSFSNSGSSWSDWEAYGISKSSWNLTLGYGGNTDQGEKRVYARFKDANGNISASVSDTTIYDTSGPTISSIVESMGSTGATATVTWSTNEAATTAIYYDTSTKALYTLYASSSTSSDYDTNHRRDLSSLTTGTTYYYMLRSVDRAGNATVSDEGTFTTTTFPTVSGVSSGTPTISSATISWSTNINANSLVAYGTTDSYGSGAGDPNSAATSHSTTISGLAKNTLYHFKIRSRDANGNIVSDTDHTFTTSNDDTPPSGTVVINNGDTYSTSATVNLAINATDTGEGGYVYQMKFSNDGATWSSYETYAGTKSWDITNVTYGGSATNGAKSVYVKLKDNHTNETSAEISDSITYDTNGPSANTPSATSPTNSTKPTWSWSASSDAVSGIQGYYVKIGTTAGGNETLAETWIGNNTSYTPTSALADNTYYLSVKAKDGANNSGSYNTSDTGVIVDTTAPTSGTISVAAGASYTNSATADLTLSATSATYMRFSNNGTNWTDYEAYAVTKSSWNMTTGYGGSATEGTKNVYVQYKDTAGNESSIYNDSIVYDITAPANGSISIKDASDSGETYTDNATVTLTLNAQDGVSGVYQMKFSNDGATWSTYETYATSKSWDITDINYGGTTVNGTKTVYVKYKDNATNETSTTISDTITFDNTAPTANTPSATSPTNNTKPTWSWSASSDTNGVQGYYVKIGTSAGGNDTLTETWIGNNTSYAPTAALSDGTYYLSVKAKDNVGNTGSYNTSDSGVTIDTAAPTSGSISINSAADYTTSTSVTLTISASGASQMNISNDGTTWNGWETYATTKSWTLSSSDGLKTVYIKFRDSSNNESVTNTDTINLDSTAPTVSSIVKSMGSTGATATVTWSTNEAATTAIYYDTSTKALYTLYASSSTSSDYDTNHQRSLSSLSTGTTYYYMLRSVDRAGNATVSDEGTFTTTTFPVVSDVLANVTGKTTTTVTFNTNISTDSFVEYGATNSYGASQGVVESATSHSVYLVGLNDNTTYHYRARAKDSNGNLAVSSDGTFTTAADSEAPTGSVSVSNGTTYINTASATLYLAATDTGGGTVSQMRFSNNGTDWSSAETYASTKTWDLTNATYGGSSAQGVKTSYVQFKDSYNNWSISYSDTIIYDNVAPTVSAPSNVSATNSQKPSISWSAATDATAGVEGYYIKIGTTDGGAEDLSETWIGSVVSYTPTSNLSEGTHYAQIKAKDNAGNISAYTASATVAIDITAPAGGSISIDSAASYATSTLVTLTLSASGASQMNISNDGATWNGWETYATTKSWTLSAGEGQKTVYAKYKDTAGNESAIASDAIIYDATAPEDDSVSIKDSNEDDTTYSDSTTVDLSPSAKDENSGIYQMRFSNDNITWGSWISYATSYNDTWTLSSTDGSKTVYAQFKDNAGNVSTAVSDTIILDTTAPTANTPSATSPTNNTKPTWSWSASSDTNGVQGYYVKIGTSAGGNDTLTETWIGNNTSYAPTTALSDGTYYLSVKAKDNVGNTGSYNTSDSGVTIDTAAPTSGSISINSAADYTTSTSVTLTISASGASQMNISNDGTTWNGWETYATTKSWTLSSSDGLKTVYIKFRDSSNNESATSTDTITLDSTAPAISSVASSSVTYNSAIISWTTSEGATSQVEYGLDTNYGTTTTVDSDKNIDHRVTLSDISGGVTYHYRVRSTDTAGNESISSDQTFTTVLYPVISAVTSGGITNNAAIITWTTNVGSDSYVEYGATTSYGAIIGKSESATSHSVSVSGLLASTTYHYRVRSTDAYGNLATSSDYTLATSATASPTISISDTTLTSPQAKDVVTTDITIVWATAVAGSSYVDYGLTSSYGASAGKEESVTSHSVTLIGLQSNTTYHYRVRSVDKDGNIYISSDMTLTTPALTTPSISNVSISDIGLTSAIISWKTNKTASTQAEYGTSADSFGSSTIEDTSPNTTHSIKLADLTSGVTYYFRVKSRDSSSGDLLISNTYSFSTITFPTVSNISVVDISEAKATVTWLTNVATDALVEFGKTNALDSQQGITESTTNHRVTLVGLDASTTYYYRVKSRDIYGNLSVGSVTTFSSKSDTTGPVISDIKSETSTVGSGDTSRVQVIVSWSTDESSTSVVEYGSGLGATTSNGDKTYEKKTREEAVYNQSHIVILTDLKPSTTYHLRVKSTDKSNNDSHSQDYTVLTPPKEESLLQVILKSLEDTFGWIGNIKNMFIK